MAPFEVQFSGFSLVRRNAEPKRRGFEAYRRIRIASALPYLKRPSSARGITKFHEICLTNGSGYARLALFLRDRPCPRAVPVSGEPGAGEGSDDGQRGCRQAKQRRKGGLSLRQQNKKMLKSRGESRDVVENKGQKKLGCTETQDVIENKRVARLTRDVYENT